MAVKCNQLTPLQVNVPPQWIPRSGTPSEMKHLTRPIMMQLLIDEDQLVSTTAVELANLLQLEKLLERGNTQIILNLTHNIWFQVYQISSQVQAVSTGTLSSSLELSFAVSQGLSLSLSSELSSRSVCLFRSSFHCGIGFICVCWWCGTSARCECIVGKKSLDDWEWCQDCIQEWCQCWKQEFTF